MSLRKPIYLHPRGTTLALGPITATISDGISDSSTAAPTFTPTSSLESSTTSRSSKSKSTKTAKAAKSSESTTSSTSSFPDIAISIPSSSSSISSGSSITPTFTSSTRSTSTTSHPQAAASTSVAASSSHSSGTSPGLVALAVVASVAFVIAVIWAIMMRRHHQQREWTFQQHQRIFERFEKDKDHDNVQDVSHTHTVENVHPILPVEAPDHSTVWPAGTGGSVITTGPSVIRNLDWDQGPEKEPQKALEEKPRRKPVPPPKEGKRKTKTFSQYIPYLLPQHHSAEVIELGKAQAQVYQRPVYKPAG